MKRWIVGITDVKRKGKNVGVKLSLIGWLSVDELPTLAEVGHRQGLSGFVEFDREVDPGDLAELVSTGKALVSHPAAQRLWVIAGEDGTVSRA